MNADTLRELIAKTREVWDGGGWAMYALAVNALVIFGMGSLIFFKLAARGLFASPERAWRRWLRRPERATGTLGRIIGAAMASRSLIEMEHAFDRVRNDEIHPFSRDLRVMKVGVAVAPLLGLLGTVTGMLATFGALATGGGGDKTMGMIAAGISEALITTKTGLVLALGGVMFQYTLTRQHERFGTHLEQVATRCMQAWRRGDAPAAGAGGDSDRRSLP